MMFRVKHCREVAFKLLYQVDLMGVPLKDIAPHSILDENLNFFPDLTAEEKNYIADLLNKVIEEQEKIDQLISKNLIGWKFERLLPVDRNLLRLGLAESFIHNKKAIIIDDIIRIAKKYSGDDSFKIINAILDKALA